MYKGRSPLLSHDGLLHQEVGDQRLAVVALVTLRPPFLSDARTVSICASVRGCFSGQFGVCLFY
jgi:hypothetical protein